MKARFGGFEHDSAIPTLPRGVGGAHFGAPDADDEDDEASHEKAAAEDAA